MHRERVKLFGAPRGNRVMKSKRVTGESAQRILCTHVALEHCHVAGCDKPVIATRNFTGIDKERSCIDHVAKQRSSAKGFDWKAALGRSQSFTALTKRD